MSHEISGFFATGGLISCGAGAIGGIVVAGAALEVAPFAAIATVAWAILSVMGANTTVVAIGIALPLALAAPGIVVGVAAVVFAVGSLFVGLGLFAGAAAFLPFG